MIGKMTRIYVAHELRQRDLLSFTPSLFADLFRLNQRRAGRRYHPAD